MAGANAALRILRISTNREKKNKIKNTKKPCLLLRCAVGADAERAHAHQGPDVSATETSCLFCFSSPPEHPTGLLGVEKLANPRRGEGFAVKSRHVLAAASPAD